MSNVLEATHVSDYVNSNVRGLKPGTILTNSAPAQLCTPTTVLAVAAFAFTASTWTILGQGGNVSEADLTLNERPCEGANVDEILSAFSK